MRGSLVKWARQQQGLTMRQIRERGGPCPAYQSEVENGLKAEVTTETLVPWVRALGVTVPYTRGDLPRYTEEPGRCIGLAAGVLIYLAGRTWTGVGPLERARIVLGAIPAACPYLPRPVLAHVMGLELEALQAMLAGLHPILRMPLQGLCTMTTLPEAFFHMETDLWPAQEGLDEYRLAVHLARRAGISPERLAELVRQL